MAKPEKKEVKKYTPPDLPDGPITQIYSMLLAAENLKVQYSKEVQIAFEKMVAQEEKIQLYSSAMKTLDPAYAVYNQANQSEEGQEKEG